MKKPLLFLILGIGLLLSGCFQIHRTIFINKDGSGRLVQKVMIMKELQKDMSSTKNDMEKLKKEESKFGEGVKYVSSQEISEGEMNGYEVTYSFSDITKLKLEVDASASLINMGFGSSNKEYITFLFKKGKNAELQVFVPQEKEEENLPEEADEEMSEEELDETWEMTKEIYANLKLSTRIIIDGKISETDAEHVEKNEIILEDLDFREMMKDEKVMRMMKNSESAQDMNVKAFGDEIPGRKVESKDKITIKFK